MGFNLGLAAAAFQGARAEQRRIADDEFLKAQRDYTLANQSEHLSRRPQRDNAAALADERVTADRGLLPTQTENAKKRLGLEGQTIDSQTSDLAFKETQRPTIEKTATLAADTGLKNAETAFEDASDIRAWSPQRRKLNAQKIDFAIADNAMLRDEYQEKVLAGLYEAGTTGKMDENAIIHRINAVGESQLFPELHGRSVADIELKGDVMEMRDAGGKTIATFPVERMKAAHAKRNPAKVMSVADGTNLYSVSPNGQAATALTQNKKSFNPNSGAVGRAGGSGAVLDRFAAALMEEAKAGGKPMTQAEAMRQASAALKTNPRGWAFKLLQNDFEYTSEQDPEKKRAMEAEAVEAMTRLGGGGGGAPEAPGLSTVSPATGAKIKGFIGLK